MKRVEFVLTMPTAGSWDGKWSGKNRHHAQVRKMNDRRAEDLGLPRSWTYNFGDGWTAKVSARVMEKGERAKPTAGFCGYSWMIDSILDHGKIQLREDRRKR